MKRATLFKKMTQTKDDFWSQYSSMCLKAKIYPCKSIIKNLKSTDLSCIVEAIRSEHWKHLLAALRNDNSLTKVHFASCVSPHEDEDEIVQAKVKKQPQYFPTPYGRTPKNISNMAVALNYLLQKSQILSILKLENLSFTSEDAEQLAQGLCKSSSLKYLSLSGCHFEEGAFPVICKSLNVSRVSWIDFSFCALSLPDIEAVGNIIKAHCIRRPNEMFPKTLRNQESYLQDVPGLSRISLNYNSLEDKALKILIESLADDYWVKALDLQNCDIDSAGASALLDLSSRNRALVVIDLRMNQIDESLLDQITTQLEKNKADNDIKFSELPLWKPSELVRKYNNIGKMKISKKSTAHRFKISKKVTRSYLNVKKKSYLDVFFESLSHKPEIKYTYLMASKDKNVSGKENCCSIRYGFKDASSQTPTDSSDVNELLVVLKNLRHRLQNEMKIRKFLLAKYRQVNIENAELRQMLKSQNDDIYIDQETFFDVKHTFEKLKVFFDVMKKYGLWEYISMLGFDESTNVTLEESNSQKCMKVIREASYAAGENTAELDNEACSCTCPKHDSKICKIDALEDVHQCIAGTSAKSLHSKVSLKEDRMNEKVAYKISQEAYHQVLNSKLVSGKMSDNVLPPDNKKLRSKPLGQPGVPIPNASANAQMLIKKFSYSNMPKQLKELVSPTDFYNIVKKELERCENEAKKPYNSMPTESYESSSSASVNSAQSKKASCKTYKCKNEINAPTVERRESVTSQDFKISYDDDDFENIPISELISCQKMRQKNNLPKKGTKSSDSSVSNSKIYKNSNHAKIKEIKSLSKSEEELPQLKQNLSGSQINSKGIQSRYNASSDEINSSDSIVTASDNVSSRSSVSSSSSNKSHGKLSDVTDASTFGEIESIADAEVVSETFFPVGSLNESVKSSIDTITSGPSSSHSSTLKDASESKSNKSNKSAISGSSSIKDSSKKDNSAKINTQPQGKNKNANKHNKNRPKSNSSKSSSIPSLSEITTVSDISSRTLKTYADKFKGKK